MSMDAQQNAQSKNQQIRQSRAEKLLKKEAGSLRKPTLLISAAAYTTLVFIVIYGAHNHVYDGFGKAAPWVVGGIFALMAVLRIAEFLRSLSDYKLVRDFLENRGLLKAAESELEEDIQPGQPDYDAFDEVNKG